MPIYCKDSVALWEGRRNPGACNFLKNRPIGYCFCGARGLQLNLYPWSPRPAGAAEQIPSAAVTAANYMKGEQGMKKKLLSALLVLSMLLTLLPTRAFAENVAAAEDEDAVVETAGAAEEDAVVEAEDAEAVEEVAAEAVTVSYDGDAQDNDELFYQYMLQLARGESASSGRPGGPRKAAARQNITLTDAETYIYDELEKEIKLIAKGESGHNSSVIEVAIPNDKATTWGWTWDKRSDTSVVNTTTINRALLANCPYDLYWYDKTTGVSINLTSSGSYVGKIKFTFSVATGYGDNNAHTVTASSALGTVATNVTKIINDNKDSTTVSVTINKAVVTITAKDASAYTGDKLPAFTYTAEGFVGSDKLTEEPTVSCPTADMTKTGEYPIVAEGSSAGDNYTIRRVKGTLTVTDAPYVPEVDGGSPSGGTTSTTTEPDGTTTTTTTRPDGTVTETTTEPDGIKTVTETKPDGTTATAATDPNGDLLSASADVSPKSVEAAQQNGEPVTLPIEVPAADSVEDAAPIEISMPNVDEPVDVEIPVANVNPGVVAVIVNPDGTEEIVKDCVVTDDGVVLCLDGDATVKVVDNTKAFDDIPGNNWASDDIRFVTAREIFNGTGCGSFSPNNEMSRGMLAQVLYNFDRDAAPVSGEAFPDATGKWYDDAANWAASIGVVTGTGASFEGQKDITREQLAAMLYRYAKAKGYDISVDASLTRFSDASSVSGYAEDAMRWAVAHGLIKGTGAGLNPRGSATRAQVAAIMARFCANVVR